MTEIALRTPFSRGLIESSITPPKTARWGRNTPERVARKLWGLQELAGLPEKVLRVREDMFTTSPLNVIKSTWGEQVKGWDLAREFGVPIPNTQVVIGPSDREKFFRVYTIVDKIHGYPTMSHPSGEFDDVFVRMLSLIVYSARNGGYVFQDLTKPEEMFMWGRRDGEEKDQVWLVDIDINTLEKGNYGRMCGLLKSYYNSDFGIWSMPKAKAKTIEGFRSVPKNNSFYWIAKEAIERISQGKWI